MKKSFDIGKINGTIVDMIDDHILVCDRKGQIIFSNKAIQSFLGYTASELRQKSMNHIIADIHRNKAKAFMETVSEKPSDPEEFLLRGKRDMLKLHLKFFGTRIWSIFMVMKNMLNMKEYEKSWILK